MQPITEAPIPLTTHVAESIGKRFVDMYVNCFHKLVEDSYQRVQQVKDVETPQVSSLLGRGVWYSTDYYLALRKFKQADRLAAMEKNGNFFHGFAPSAFVEPVADASSLTNRKLYTYKVKKGFTPTQSLESLEKGCSLLECRSVIQLAAFRALKDLMPEKFDYLFAADSPTPFCVSGEDRSSPIMKLFEDQRISGEEQIQKGDIFHISNIQAYMGKHPAGIARGFNLVCQKNGGDKRYLGFGLAPAGADIPDVERALLEAYNEDPLLEGYYSQELWNKIYETSILGQREASSAYVRGQKDKKLTWEQFQSEPIRNAHRLKQQKGKLLLEVCRPSLKRIEQLAQAKLEEVRKVF